MQYHCHLGYQRRKLNHGHFQPAKASNLKAHHISSLYEPLPHGCRSGRLRFKSQCGMHRRRRIKLDTPGQAGLPLSLLRYQK